MFMILQTGNWNCLFSRDHWLELCPHQHLTCQHLLSWSSSASPTSPSFLPTPFTATRRSPGLPQKKLPTPTSPQEQHLPNFWQVTRKDTFPACFCYAPSNLRTAGTQQQHYSFSKPWVNSIFRDLRNGFFFLKQGLCLSFLHLTLTPLVLQNLL